MTFDIPHMIATAFAVFGISWLVDHVSLFDAMSRGRKTLLLAALGLSLGAAPPLAAQQATDDHAGAVAGAAAPVSDALAAARAAFAAGELDPSLVALKTALQQNAFDQDALLLLADVLLARFDSASAEATLRRALEVGAPREQVLPALAKTMILQGQAAQVLAELEPTAGMAGPARARLLAQHATARMALGENEQAAALLEEAVSASDQVFEPFSVRAAMAMADADWDAARADLRRAIERAAWDDEPWLLLGALEQAVGERAAAEATYGEAIAQAPVHWRSAHARALLRLDRADLDGAAADIELVQAEFPEFIGLIFARARLDLAQGRVAEAAEGFERYLGGLPADVDALFYAALAAEALGNVAQAQEYRERLGSRPGQGWRKLWLEARVLLDRDDAEAAEALLREPLAQGEAPALLPLLYADALTRQGRFDEALELLQRAHGARPESPGLRAALARLKMRSGDRDGAIALAESLSAEDPGNALAVEILADAALAEGGFDGAWLSRLEDAAGAAPQNAKLRLLLGRGHAAQGDLEQGCAAVTDALLQGATQDALSDLGRFKCAMRAPKRLREAYERLSSTDAETAQRLLALFPDAVGGEDQGLGPAQAALAAAPDNPTLRGALAANQLRAQQLDAAQATLDEAPEDQRGESALIRGRAALAMARGDFLATERELQALSALDPNAAEPFFTLAAAALAAGDPAAAGDWLSEGLGRDPTSPVGEAIAARLFAAEATDDGRRALIDLVKLAAPESPVVPSLDAQRLLAAGRNAEALAVLRRAAERHSDSAGLMLLLAMALDAEGQTEQAIAQSQAWLDTHPVASNLAHWLAQAQIKTGALDAAIATYRRLLMQAPVDALALNNLAALVTEDDPTEAATLAGRALELAPESADFLDTFGAALLAKGEPDAARGYLERAYAGSGGNPAIGLNLARAELALGRADAAAKLLRDLASQEFPDQAQAQALLRQAQTP